MRRSTVLRGPFQLVFPAQTYLDTFLLGDLLGDLLALLSGNILALEDMNR
jgi:hypothetical protein